MQRIENKGAQVIFLADRELNYLRGVSNKNFTI